MKDQTIVAYCNGIEVMIIPEYSSFNENGTMKAAIEKIDDCVPDGIPVPKDVPFDSLSFLPGKKYPAKKRLKNFLKNQEKKINRKNKTIKKPILAIH